MPAVPTAPPPPPPPSTPSSQPPPALTRPSATPQFNVINRHNIVEKQSLIRDVLDRASHIAIDCEFTGLGMGSDSKAANIADRYTALNKIASTHAVVSFGLSAFELVSPPDAPQYEFAVHNFEFIMLSKAPFTVASDSMLFLVDNGFDFNRQYTDGIFYWPGNDREASHATDTNVVIRNIFLHLLSRNVPVVVHNGLLDLLFIYNALFAGLPKDLATFVADLDEMFPAGIYDTKYISEYVYTEKSTYLAYLFRKCEREQAAMQASGKGRYIRCTIRDRVVLPHTKRWMPAVAPELNRSKKRRPSLSMDDNKPYCTQYAVHGYCRNGRYCGKTHDLEVILDAQAADAALGGNKKKKRKTLDINEPPRQEEQGPAAAPPPPTGQGVGMDGEANEMEKEELAQPPDAPLPPLASQPNPASQHFHSAGFDAYMTGYLFAWYFAKFHTAAPSASSQPAQPLPTSLKDAIGNKLYLMGKDIPLLVEKSAFAKTSVEFRRKKDALLASAREPRGRPAPGQH
ncbi:Target of EGR1, member 1 (Nuclear) [Geranomyces michiganensis]|nr:Target of EGR1, member 1 (Nuclear) [Geranomyces michiganensis]